MHVRFNISKSMLYNYLSDKYDIPENIVRELERVSGFVIRNYERTEKEKYIEKKIIKPDLDESLAEIFGVLNGDGHMAPLNYEICVVISTLEQNYLRYLKELFEGSLKLEFKVYTQDTRVKLRTNSKEMTFHFNGKYGIPFGNKLGKLEIPKQLFKSKILLRAYLRGLYDTDGCFYVRREKDPVIEITSADPIYLKQIQKTLILLGFNARITKLKIYIYDKKHIKKFFEKIKPANTKHLKKYQSYLKICVGS